jgi:hypothetical protein
MSDAYTKWRVHSLTNPDKHGGLHEGYAAPGTIFTDMTLQDFEPPLYAGRIEEVRGTAGLEEDYVLQGYCDGEWMTIKSIDLLPGEEPELEFGDCAECGIELEEAEFALGKLCRDCLDAVHEAREAATW